MKLAELELGGIDYLVGVGMGGSAFHIDGSDKEIERGGKSQEHARAGGYGLGLDIGKAPGGEENADALANLVAVERQAGFLREDLEQVVAVRHAGQFDGLDGASGTSGHSGESGGRLRALRLLRRL